MIRGIESLCCKEVQRTSTKAKESNCECITEVNDFAPVCLNPDVVETSYLSISFKSRVWVKKICMLKVCIKNEKKRVNKEKIKL